MRNQSTTRPPDGTSGNEEGASTSSVRDRIARLDADLGFMAATFPPAERRPTGRFAGESLLVKDLDLKLAGKPLWRGNSVLREHRARSRYDDAFGRRLREFGFDIVGRTKSAEFGLAVTTEPDAYGPVHNPWDHDRSVGGSSGGSACAVAARAVPIAHGTDLGGSLRIPAAHCGVLALRRGLVRAPTTPTFAAWNQHGFLASKVDYLRQMLAVLGRDQTRDPSPLGPSAAQKRVLRVGMLASTVSSATELEPNYIHVVTRVADKLSNHGHDVRMAHPPALEQFDQFTTKATPMLASWLAKEVTDASRDLGRRLSPTDMEPGTSQMLAMAAHATPEAAPATARWLRRLVADLSAWWGQFDILLSPTVPIQAPPLGWLSDPETAMGRTFGMMQYTALFNASGHPAINVPYVESDGCLPYGVQLVGQRRTEANLLSLAEQLVPDEVPAPPVT